MRDLSEPRGSTASESAIARTSMRRILENRNPDPWADPKSRSTLGFCNLRHRVLESRIGGSTFWILLGSGNRTSPTLTHSCGSMQIQAWIPLPIPPCATVLSGCCKAAATLTVLPMCARSPIPRSSKSP